MWGSFFVKGVDIMGKKTNEVPTYTPDEETAISMIAKELQKFQSSERVIREAVKLADFPSELEEGFIKNKREFAWSRCEIKMLEILAAHQGVPLDLNTKG
jgi:hypothetical protein